MQKAYVLHQRPYRETSVLVDFFTEQDGRISAIAKGQRRLQKRGRHSLQMFVLLLVDFYGKGELKTVKTIECVQTATIVPGRALLSAFYLNELLIHLLTRAEAMPELFQAYHHTIAELAHVDTELTLRRFEWQLLQKLGYGFSLTETRQGDAIQTDKHYYFDFGHGFDVAIDNEPDGQESMRYLGQDLLALAQGHNDNASVLLTAKRLLQQAFYVLLEGKTLQTRQLYQQMQTIIGEKIK